MIYLYELFYLFNEVSSNAGSDQDSLFTWVSFKRQSTPGVKLVKMDICDEANALMFLSTVQESRYSVLLRKLL